MPRPWEHCPSRIKKKITKYKIVNSKSVLSLSRYKLNFISKKTHHINTYKAVTLSLFVMRNNITTTITTLLYILIFSTMAVSSNAFGSRLKKSHVSSSRSLNMATGNKNAIFIRKSYGEIKLNRMVDMLSSVVLTIVLPYEHLAFLSCLFK